MIAIEKMCKSRCHTLPHINQVFPLLREYSLSAVNNLEITLKKVICHVYLNFLLYIIENAYVSLAVSRVNSGPSNKERSRRTIMIYVTLWIDPTTEC